MAEPHPTRSRFQFELWRLLAFPTLLAISLVTAKVPYAVAISSGRGVPYELATVSLAILSGGFGFGALGILFKRGGAAAMIGMIVGAVIGVIYAPRA